MSYEVKLETIIAIPQSVRVLLCAGALDLVGKGFAGPGRWLLLNHNQLVAWIEENGVPLAVATLEGYQDEGVLWVSLAYVEPAARRRGMFRALVAFARVQAFLRRLPRVSLGVHSRNERMLTAVQQMGMEETFRRFVLPSLPPGMPGSGGVE